MVREYKITKSSKWEYFYKILLKTLSISVIATYVYKQYKNIPHEDLFLIIILGPFLAWFFIFGLPLFILYFNHKKASKLVTFVSSDNFFSFDNSKKKISFYMDEIDNIELWLTPPAYDKRIDWQFFGKYHFTSIQTKKGDVINISCLVFDQTEKTFPNELIRRKKKFFPFVKKSIIGHGSRPN